MAVSVACQGGRIGREATGTKSGIIMQPVGIHNSFPTDDALSYVPVDFRPPGSPRYPLVVAANRDEFHARPTAPAQFWEDHPQLLAGQRPGAGRHLDGRHPQRALRRHHQLPRSRTHRSSATLPRRITAGLPRRQQAPADYLAAVGPVRGVRRLQPAAGRRRHLWYFSNSCGPESDPECLPPGIYGLSNARWIPPGPKSDWASQTAALLQGALPTRQLAQLVADRRPAIPRHWHCRACRGHGSAAVRPVHRHRQLRHPLQHHAVDRRDGDCHWRELSFDAAGGCAKTLQTSSGA